MEGMVN